MTDLNTNLPWLSVQISNRFVYQSSKRLTRRTLHQERREGASGSGPRILTESTLG